MHLSLLGTRIWAAMVPGDPWICLASSPACSLGQEHTSTVPKCQCPRRALPRGQGVPPEWSARTRRSSSSGSGLDVQPDQGAEDFN